MKKLAVIVFGLIVSSASFERAEQACPAFEWTSGPGDCFVAIPKYFSTLIRRSEEFIWRGCAGVVPFETMEECACS